MGNVMMAYKPERALERFIEDEATRDVVMQELFKGAEWIQGDLGHMDNEAKYQAIHKRIDKRHHQGLRRCIDGWQETMQPSEEAQSFVDYVKAKGYNIYVLSNASDEFYTYFPRFSPLTHWDGIVVSSDIHLIKPDAESYRYLLEKYDLDPSECLFLDDMPANIEAARAVGFVGEVFTGDFEAIKVKYAL